MQFLRKVQPVVGTFRDLVEKLRATTRPFSFFALRMSRRSKVLQTGLKKLWQIKIYGWESRRCDLTIPSSLISLIKLERRKPFTANVRLTTDHSLSMVSLLVSLNQTCLPSKCQEDGYSDIANSLQFLDLSGWSPERDGRNEITMRKLCARY